MSKYISKINPLFAINITLCSNAESVCDGEDASGNGWVDEAREIVAAGCDAVYKLTGELADTDSNFHKWHGGDHARNSKGPFGVWLVAASPRTRTDVESDWEWCADTKVPADVTEEFFRVSVKISDAMEAERAVVMADK